MIKKMIMGIKVIMHLDSSVEQREEQENSWLRTQKKTLRNWTTIFQSPNGHHQHHNQLQQKDSLITFKGLSFGNPLINGHTKNSNGSRSEEDLTSPSVASGIIDKMIPPPTSCRPSPKPRIGINVKPPVNRVASNSFVYPSPRKGWTRRVNPRSQVYFISRSSSLLNLSSPEVVTQSSFRLKPPASETPVVSSTDKKKIEKKDSKQEEPPLDKKKISRESPSQSSSRVKSTSSSDSLTQSSIIVSCHPYSWIRD